VKFGRVFDKIPVRHAVLDNAGVPVDQLVTRPILTCSHRISSLMERDMLWTTAAESIVTRRSAPALNVGLNPRRSACLKKLPRYCHRGGVHQLSNESIGEDPTENTSQIRMSRSFARPKSHWTASTL
jgi:hypothetical protein